MICERTVKAFCKDFTKIENYEKAMADSETWDCHHRAEIIYTAKELKDKGMYYNVLPCDLIFLTSLEHVRLHHKGKNLSEDTKRKLSEAKKGHEVYEETRRKISEAMKGKSTWNKGKKASDETKKRMSEAQKGHEVSEETRRKMSETRKGKHWKLVDGKRVWY